MEEVLVGHERLVHALAVEEEGEGLADADVVLGTLAEGADVSLVTADLTGLTLRPGRLAALVAENSRLLLRLTTPKGTTIVFR